MRFTSEPPWCCSLWCYSQNLFSCCLTSSSREQDMISLIWRTSMNATDPTTTTALPPQVAPQGDEKDIQRMSSAYKARRIRQKKRSTQYYTARYEPLATTVRWWKPTQIGWVFYRHSGDVSIIAKSPRLGLRKHALLCLIHRHLLYVWWRTSCGHQTPHELGGETRNYK